MPETIEIKILALWSRSAFRPKINTIFSEIQILCNADDVVPATKCLDKRTITHCLNACYNPQVAFRVYFINYLLLKNPIKVTNLIFPEKWNLMIGKEECINYADSLH